MRQVMKPAIMGAGIGFGVGLLLLIMGCFLGGRGESSFGAFLLFFGARILNFLGYDPVPPSLHLFDLGIGAAVFIAVPTSIGLFIGALLKRRAKHSIRTRNEDVA